MNEQIQTTPQVRIALRNAISAVIGSALADGLYLYLILQNPAWQLSAALIDTLLLLIAALFSVSLIRRGNLTRGMWVLIGATEFVFVIGAALFTDMGVAFGLGIIALILMMVIPTLPPRQVYIAIVSSFLTGLVCVLFDVLAPAYRMPVPVLVRIVIPAIIGAVVLIFSYFLIQYIKFLDLRLKTFMAFIVVSLISIGILSFVTNTIVRTELTRSVGADLKGKAQSQARIISDQLTTQVDIISALGLSKTITDKVKLANANYDTTDPNLQAGILQLDQQWIAANAANNDSDPLVQSRLNSLLATELRTFRATAPQHVEVFVTDQYGALVATTNRTSDYYQADEAWWQAAFNNGQGAVYIDQPALDESSGIVSCILAVPLYDPATHAVIGIMRSTLNVSFLEHSLELAKFGTTGQVDLLLPNGQSLEWDGAFEEVEPDALAQLRSLGGQDYTQLNYQGGDRLISQVDVISTNPNGGEYINNLSWKTIAEQDSSEALQLVNTAVRTGLLTSLGVLLLAGLISIFVAQTLVRPIDRLIATAEKVRAGDLTVQAKVETRDEIGTLAATFNSMTAQLHNMIGTLEQRVVERTRELEKANEVIVHRAARFESIALIARTISSTQTLDTLLPQITDTISKQFRFYHVGIFLLDTHREYAILVAANSEGGKKMLERNHRLLVGGSGIVGFVTKAGQPRVALDVGLDAAFFNNPDLPDTHSEMALPLHIGIEIIGALDVQSMETNAFSQEDVSILSTLADQVSIAIQNARSYQQSREALAQAEAASIQMSGQQWKQFFTAQPVEGFVFDGIDAKNLTPADKQRAHSLAIPLTLRGTRIGALKLSASDPNRTWTEDEIAMVEATAERTALALENARLLEDAQKRAAKEQAIGEISAKIGSLVDIDNILQITIQELSRTLPDTEVAIQFQHKE